jgi:DNA-binding transcriptional LysR family regulator
MRAKHLRQVDLNLLLALYALLEERHVTRAAKRCFLSQSAMSRALERLQETFGDPLLIRSGRVYERTARGNDLLKELETLLPRLEAMVHGEEFRPERSEERFRVALTDHASLILMPSLMGKIRAEAPNVKIVTSPWGNQSYDDVAAGRIDVVLCAESSPPTLETEVLFELDFVCVIGSTQKLRTNRLTLEQYLRLPHVLVETWAGQQTLVDRPLAQLGVKRRVVLSVPFFVPSIFAVAYTDMAVTLPRRLVTAVGAIPGVRLAEPPREIKPFPYFMTWHPRLTGEPPHAWFREQLRLAARTL